MVASGGCGCSGGCAWLLPGGHVWLHLGVCMVAPGGHAWLLPGGMHGCSQGGTCMVAPRGVHGCSQGRACVGYDEIWRYNQ